MYNFIGNLEGNKEGIQRYGASKISVIHFLSFIFIIPRKELPMGNFDGDVIFFNLLRRPEVQLLKPFEGCGHLTKSTNSILPCSYIYGVIVKCLALAFFQLQNHTQGSTCILGFPNSIKANTQGYGETSLPSIFLYSHVTQSRPKS